MPTIEIYTKIAKITLLLLETLYFVFAFIMVKQIGLMNGSFTTKAKAMFEWAARLQVLATCCLIILTLLVA
jgi:hypothetical protein